MIKLLILLFCASILGYNIKRRQLISSSTIWVVCYILIFVVCPLFEHRHVFKNSDLIDIYALIGIFAFFVGNLFFRQVVLKDRASELGNNYIFPTYQFALKCFEIISIFVLFLMLLKYGSSIFSSIISGTMTSRKIMRSAEDGSIGMLEMFGQILVPCLLAVWFSADTPKRRVSALLCLGIYIAYSVMFSFTRIFMISVLAIILIYEIRNFTLKKQSIILSLGVSCLFIFMVSMNFIRCHGLGKEIDAKTLFDVDYMFESSDFSSSYYWFDKLLSIEPPYLSFLVYLKPFVFFIPRSIWPDKPEQSSMQVLKILDPSLVKTGYSTAGYSVIGEGYVMLGEVGIFLFPLIWGILCGKLDDGYYRRLHAGVERCYQNVFYYIYAVFIMISAQRGDWCQYLIIVFWFYYLPLYLMSKKYR